MFKIRRTLLYFASAIALAFSSMGFADVLRVPSAVAAYVADAGKYGSDYAVHQASVAQMYTLADERMCSLTGALTVMSHGFVQDSLVGSGVTEGMIGATGMATV
jgi:hypothetical protein